MIEVRRIGVEDPGWAERVVQCGGHALHLPAVQLVDASSDQVHLWALEEGTEVVACVTAVETASRSSRWSLRRRRQLVLPTAPALRDPERGAEVRDTLLDLAAREGFERIHVGASGSDWMAEDENLAPYRGEAITEFVLDLREGPDAVFANMHKTHRKNVRRARREGFDLRRSADLEALLVLRTVQLASSERVGERSEGFAVRDEDFYRRLHETVYAPGHGQVLVARDGDRPLAALAWLSLGPRAQTVRSGSLPEGYRSRVMYLLYDELIRHCTEHGIEELNAGGVPAAAVESGHPQSGLYEFKQGFGGRAVTRHALEIPVGEVVR